MDAIKGANLALRFLLEIGALVAFAYWGFSVGDGWAGKLLLGIGIPLLVGIIWSIFVAHRSAVSTPVAAKGILGLIILEAAAVALAAAGRAAVAVAFGGIVVINAVLIVIWEQ